MTANGRFRPVLGCPRYGGVPKICRNVTVSESRRGRLTNIRLQLEGKGGLARLSTWVNICAGGRG